MDTGSFKSKFEWRNMGRTLSDFLYKRTKWFLFFFLLVVAGYSFFLWYRFIYRSEWSDARKQEYMKTKDTGVIINKSRFLETVREYERRGEEYQKKIDPGKDIFRLKK